MAANSTKHPQRTVAIEVCHSTLEVACLEPVGSDRQVSVRSLTWRREARSLADVAAIDELAATLRKLVAELRLASPVVHLALSPDSCVTRVIVGRNDEVRSELRNVEERCQSYLLLGGGPKSVGGCVRQVDAKVQHASLAVVNRQVLTNLVAAAAKAGVKLEIVEPAVVAVSRLVGRQGLDAQAPALVVQLSERGAEAGLSYQGQLLLEYRPAARMPQEQVPAILATHLGRLQRYCERYVKFAEGRIARVALCGQPEAVRLLLPGLADNIKLPVEVLQAPTCDGRWTYPGDAPGPEHCGALGVALRAAGEAADVATPNLLERIKAQTREPVLPLVMKTLWPVAAALVLGTTGWAAVLWEHLQCRAVERQIARYEPAMQRARILRAQAIRDQQKSGYLAEIAAAVARPGWNDVAATIAQCLPDDVWLDKVEDDGRGRLQLTGGSYSSDGVYELVRWLRQYPVLAQVAVSETRTTRQQSGPVTEFEIDCEMTGHAKGEGEANGRP